MGLDQDIYRLDWTLGEFRILHEYCERSSIGFYSRYPFTLADPMDQFHQDAKSIGYWRNHYDLRTWVWVNVRTYRLKIERTFGDIILIHPDEAIQLIGEIDELDWDKNWTGLTLAEYNATFVLRCRQAIIDDALLVYVDG